MGFMGLKHWSESDMAADFKYELLAALHDVSVTEMNSVSNEYNTPGYVNVALLVEDGMYDSLDELDDDWTNLFNTVIEKLDNDARQIDLPDLLRLRRSVKDFVNERQ